MINDQDNIETDLALFRDLINRSNDAIFVVDALTGIFIFVNNKACSSLGYDYEELRNLRVTDIETALPDNFSWQEHVSELRQTGSLIFEGAHRRKNGTVFPVEANISYMKRTDREYLVTVVRDISERKLTDAALRKRERQLAESQRIAHIGSWEHNLKTGAVFWSDELFRLFGLDPEKDPADFDMFFKMVHPEDQPVLRDAIDKTLRYKNPFSIDYRIITRDGLTRTIHAQAELMGNEKGDQVVLSGTGQDITERKRQEQSIAGSEANYRNLFNSSTDGILILDRDGNIIDANRTAYERLGYSREEFLRLNIAKLDHPSFAPRVPQRIRQIKEYGVAVFESGHLRKDGSLMPVEVNSRLLDYKGKQVFFSVIRDITERKKAEEAKDGLLKAISAATEGIAITDAKDRFIYVNEAHARIYGYSRDELIGKSWRDTVSKDLEVLVERDFAKTLHNKVVGIWSGESPALRKDGTVLPTEVTATARWDENGNYLGHICIVRDVTERKRAAEELREKEEKYRLLFEAANDGIFIYDKAGFLDCNKKGMEMYGRTKEEIIGRSPIDFSPERQPDGRLSSDIAGGRIHEALKYIPQVFEWQSLRADGSSFDVEVTLSRLDMGGKAYLQAIVRDITDRKKLEMKISRAERLESIGTLAGGIAHDFNNLLQGVFGYISIAKLKKNDRQKSIEALEEAEKALHMSVSLTNQLLTFSKGGKPLKRPLDLPPVVEKAAKFALSGSRSYFRMNIEPNLWQAEADEGQVGQVIQNIVLNADQSMPTGGLVLITMKNLHGDDMSLPQGLDMGKYVQIAIQDTGIGIAEQNVAKIFDPYFTTKDKGSGLGLATSYSIIKNHGGVIDAKSVCGKGTTFFVYLPAVEAKKKTARTSLVSATCRKGKILVMDDEEFVRNIARDLILSLKHEVELSERGEAAIEKYRAAMALGKPFDVVILDLTIRGGMGGKETIQRLREIDPKVKAIVSSGYSGDDIVSEYKNYGFEDRLIKPYTIETMRSTLNALLSV